MTTISDVARAAGVSITTVSRVLNGHEGQASAQTVHRIREAAEALRYIPNAMARNLRAQDSRAWTLIVPTISSPFLTHVARGLEDVAQAAGVGVLLCNSDDDPDKERLYLSVAESGRASAVVLTPTTPNVDLTRLHALGIPIVSIIRPLSSDSRVDTVVIDTFAAAREATLRLLGQGLRAVACINGPNDEYVDHERLAGYVAAHRETGLAVDGSLVLEARPDEVGGRQAADSLLDRATPDAVLVANSIMTIGVVGSMIARGIDPARGPRITTFDVSPWTDALMPFVTLIRQPAYEFGRRAGELLLERKSEPERHPRIVYLNATLRDQPERPS